MHGPVGNGMVRVEVRHISFVYTDFVSIHINCTRTQYLVVVHSRFYIHESRHIVIMIVIYNHVNNHVHADMTHMSLVGRCRCGHVVSDVGTLLDGCESSFDDTVMFKKSSIRGI